MEDYCQMAFSTKQSPLDCVDSEEESYMLKPKRALKGRPSACLPFLAHFEGSFPPQLIENTQLVLDFAQKCSDNI
jgi:hypothetical protein